MKKNIKLNWRKKAVFAALPVVVLILGLELVLRVTGQARSPLQSVPLMEEKLGVLQVDEDLFWSLKPNVSKVVKGVMTKTNSLGLRSDEIGPKQPGELRILSLGESTTYGAGVRGEETYAAVLQRQLAADYPDRQVTVINAGVSSYSSFQSLMYLKLRGLKLKPDVVLFYHDINDRLPTYLRDSQNNVIGMSLSDKQRYESRQRKLHRKLLKWSAIYRAIRYQGARFSLNRYRDSDKGKEIDKGVVYLDLESRSDDQMYPPRVFPKEQWWILDELLNVCQSEGIQLIIMHPSYRLTPRHTCNYTNFCKERKVVMLECYPLLHPPGEQVGSMFLDRMHPTALGHKRLGEALADLVVSKNLLQH